MTPTGWRLVPVDVTQAMQDAAWGGMDREGLGNAIENAIAVAPDPVHDEHLIEAVARAIWSERGPMQAADRLESRSLARAVLALFRGEAG